MTKLICVMLGGAFGTVCRYSLSLLITDWLKQPKFPYATLVINVLGSFVIGWLAEWFRLQILTAVELRLALITGVLGGFTTFSAFSLETLSLLRGGELLLALLYVGCSVLFGLLAAWIGMRIGQAWSL